MSLHTNANARRSTPLVLAALVASLALIAGCDRRDAGTTTGAGTGTGTGTTTAPPPAMPPASAASR